MASSFNKDLGGILFFIAPEAYEELTNWMEFRKSCGEKINGESWVMRDLWDVKRPTEGQW